MNFCGMLRSHEITQPAPHFCFSCFFTCSDFSPERDLI
jgi:hypothetical protein